MSILLIVLLAILILGSGGYGIHSGWYNPSTFNGVGILPLILIVVLIVLLLR